jgi:hypothetical protein
MNCNNCGKPISWRDTIWIHTHSIHCPLTECLDGSNVAMLAPVGMVFVWDTYER